MSTGVATGMSTGVGTGMSTGVGTGMSTGVGTGMSTGVGTGMSTGVGTGCTACVIIKAVMRFPQYRLNINDRGLQSLVSHRLRYLMSRGQYPGEVWYYAYFPSAKEHNHVMLASAPGVHLPQAMSDLSDNSRLVTLDLSGLPVAKQPADASVEIEDSTISFDNHQSSLRLLRQLNMTDCVVRSETSFLALLRRLQQYLTQQRQQSTKPRQPSNLRAGCLDESGQAKIGNWKPRRGRPLKDPLLPRPARLTASEVRRFHCVNAREGVTATSSMAERLEAAEARIDRLESQVSQLTSLIGCDPTS
uniref:Coiled-coil domain-containing protein 61 n=1 Tax=Macrostomum lignano TaxID=282301 RepID=A0A1I8GY53_9PLAT